MVEGSGSRPNRAPPSFTTAFKICSVWLKIELVYSVDGKIPKGARRFTQSLHREMPHLLRRPKIQVSPPPSHPHRHYILLCDCHLRPPPHLSPLVCYCLGV